jgi:DNA polymerase III epsilon subunit-like protein
MSIINIGRDPNIIIVFDTETTGLSPKFHEIVQLSYIVYDVEERKVLFSTTLGDDIVAIKGRVPKSSSAVHGITTADTKKRGRHLLEDHINQFVFWCNQAGTIVGHNVGFDIRMVTASIEKIIEGYPVDKREEVASWYFDFLMRFQPVAQDTDTFCTLKASRIVCPKKYQVDKKKQKYKLDEVHKLLFRQEAKGQLHNALVDIAATLRVFMKLKYDIDICVGVVGNPGKLSKLTSVANDVDICKLINPVAIPESMMVPSVVYDGPLLSGLTVLPGENGILEEEFNVETVVGQVLEEIVGKISLGSVDLAPNSCSTKISLCTTIIKAGAKSGQTCGREVVIGQGVCGLHSGKSKPRKSKSETPLIPVTKASSAKASSAKAKKLTIISEEEMAQLIASSGLGLRSKSKKNGRKVSKCKSKSKSKKNMKAKK